MATMATRMALGPAPKAGLGRWSTRGRRARLEVRCRTAAEKRIEAKRNQKQSQSASRADLLAKSKKTAKSRDNADAQGKRGDARGRTRRSREDERKKSADNAKSSDKGGERKDQTASNKSTSESTAPSQRPASTSRRSKGQRFERDFGFGEQGPHVEKLQRLLLAENYLSSGDQVTGYFGRDTKEALTQWQKANRVMPSGYFGPVSRAMVNKQGAVTRAKQQIAVNLRMNPVGTVAASFALAGALAAGIAYLARERQGVAVFDPNSDEAVGSEDFIGFGAVAVVVQRAAGLLSSWIGPLLVFLQNRLGGTPLGGLGDQGALVSGYKESSGGGYQRGSTGEPSAGEEYTRRVELRRNIASLQNALGYTEDQLNSAKRQLKREKERADRAESLYLKQKATLTALEMENQKLKIELRPFRR